MRWSSIAKLSLLSLLFAGMFAFTRLVQPTTMGGATASVLIDTAHRRWMGFLAQRALARPDQPQASRGHWLHTQGRKLLTDDGHRWRATGVDVAGPQEAPAQAVGFVRLSAKPYFHDDPVTDAGELLSLADAVDALSHQGSTYVLVGLPSDQAPWLWQSRMTAIVHALANRPYVMFDLTQPIASPVAAEGSVEQVAAQLACVRQAELDIAAPAHIIAVDHLSLAPGDGHHHRRELDYARLGAELPLGEYNVVTLGRRPAYALRAANALFLEPLRPRFASVQPAT